MLLSDLCPMGGNVKRGPRDVFVESQCREPVRRPSWEAVIRL